PAAGPGHRAAVRADPDRGPERGRGRDRHPQLPLPSAGGERLRPPGRRRLPELWDDLAGGGVPDGLLPDPRPGAPGPRRGRGVQTWPPPPQRIRQPVTPTDGGATGGADVSVGEPPGCEQLAARLRGEGVDTGVDPMGGGARAGGG